MGCATFYVYIYIVSAFLNTCRTINPFQIVFLAFAKFHVIFFISKQKTNKNPLLSGPSISDIKYFSTRNPIRIVEKGMKTLIYSNSCPFLVLEDALLTRSHL